MFGLREGFQSSFDELSTPLYQVTFCIVDLETTGISAAESAITEVGAIKVRGGEAIGEFQTLVDPGGPIPPYISVLTGITEAMVAAAPTIETVFPSFLEFLGDAVVVGHNLRFDLSFLNQAASRLGYPTIENPRVDTVALARRLIRDEVRSLKLGTLAKHFRSPVTPNHRALDDVRATSHVLHSLLERAGTLGVTNLDDLLHLPTSKGAAYYSKIQLTEHLPRSPGTYIFRDRDGVVIYVGKASNLRARVRQYFYGDTRRNIANLMRELDSIDYQECATPLEAEITELRLIHAHRPRYNRRSRPPKASHFVKLTAEKFPRLSVVRKVSDDGLVYLGPFRSSRTAHDVAAAIWDATPIRRCASRPGSRTGKCAGAQIGVARCPCDGTLDPAEYQAVVDRLIHAITSDPSQLLDPLVEKMNRLAQLQRYEDAAWVRDRHDTLARALRMRQTWQALIRAGVIEVEDGSGRRVTIDHGIFADWASSTASDSTGHPEVPPSVETADEVAVLWRWLDSDQVRLVEASGTLSLPATPIRRLRTAA